MCDTALRAVRSLYMICENPFYSYGDIVCQDYGIIMYLEIGCVFLGKIGIISELCLLI